MGWAERLPKRRNRMFDFEIFVDSSANLPEETVRARNIRVISYAYSARGEEHPCYTEGMPFHEAAKKFYADMRAGMEAKTSLISEARFVAALSPVLREGKDALLIVIASGISGTYQQACAAKKTLKELFPARNVYVVDSANASLGEGLLALRAAELREEGESAKSCAEWLEENAYRMNSYVTVEDLKYLRRTGRISLVSAVAGAILGIKPIIRANEGPLPKLAVCGKVRGRKKAISALVEAYDRLADRDGGCVGIAHADCEEEANALADVLRQHGAKQVIVEYYDLCTGAHIGPGTVALFFMGQDRRETAKKESAAECAFRLPLPARKQPAGE